MNTNGGQTDNVELTDECQKHSEKENVCLKKTQRGKSHKTPVALVRCTRLLYLDINMDLFWLVLFSGFDAIDKVLDIRNANAEMELYIQRERNKVLTEMLAEAMNNQFKNAPSTIINLPEFYWRLNECNKPICEGKVNISNN